MVMHRSADKLFDAYLKPADNLFDAYLKPAHSSISVRKSFKRRQTEVKFFQTNRHVVAEVPKFLSSFEKKNQLHFTYIENL